MKRRVLYALTAVAFLLSSGCITNLRVSTEVYKGELPADPLPQTVAKLGWLAETSLQDYGKRAEETAADNYARVLQALLDRYPELAEFGITSESIPAFRTSMVNAAHTALAPAMESAATASEIARQLQSVACPSSNAEKSASPCTDTRPGDEILRQWIVALREKVSETARLGRAAIDRINDEEVAQYRTFLRGNFENPRRDGTFPNDATLARFTGRTSIRNAAERRAAVTRLLADADAITRSLRAQDDRVLQSLLVGKALAVNQVLSTTAIVPLDDEAIPMILAQTETTPGVWKKYVNDVVSNNQFGNAEIAFRMDGLGDSHIKGIVFDASQAMKTGFSVLAAGVEATATAFGGAVFAAPVAAQGSAASSGAAAGEAKPAPAPAANPLSSKPAIEAEVARLASATAMRRDLMESLFWDLTALAKGLPADSEAAADAAKKLIALLGCAENELAEPQGRRCGGE